MSMGLVASLRPMRVGGHRKEPQCFRRGNATVGLNDLFLEIHRVGLTLHARKQLITTISQPHLHVISRENAMEYCWVNCRNLVAVSDFLTIVFQRLSARALRTTAA